MPSYIQEQYDRGSNRTVRQARSAGSQGAGPRASSTESAAGPETTASEAAAAVEAEAWESSGGEPGSETESSESEAAPEGTKLLLSGECENGDVPESIADAAQKRFPPRVYDQRCSEHRSGGIPCML